VSVDRVTCIGAVGFIGAVITMLETITSQHLVDTHAVRYTPEL